MSEEGMNILKKAGDISWDSGDVTISRGHAHEKDQLNIKDDKIEGIATIERKKSNSVKQLNNQRYKENEEKEVEVDEEEEEISGIIPPETKINLKN
jgi:hypothetical protein